MCCMMIMLINDERITTVFGINKNNLILEQDRRKKVRNLFKAKF